MFTFIATIAGAVLLIAAHRWLSRLVVNRQPDEATPWRKWTEQDKCGSPLDQVAAMPIAARMRREGWIFGYRSEILVLEAKHPNGGKSSVLDVRSHKVGMGLDPDEIGHAIAAMLNSARPLHEIEEELDRLENSAKQKGNPKHQRCIM